MKGINKKRIYQIIAIILCVVMLATTGALYNLKDIFATNENPPQENTTTGQEVVILTWRDTTAQRNLYEGIDESTIGSKWYGETIDEIIQMAQDSTITFNEANFFDGTCFQGYRLSNMEFLKGCNYELDELAAIAKEHDLKHIDDYILGTMYIDNFEIEIPEIIEEELPWRESTAKRNLYEGIDESTIGSKWYGETIEEIIQMSEDPEVNFDETNFFNGTYFEGFNIAGLEYIKSEGYSLESLKKTIECNNYSHASEVLYPVSQVDLIGSLTYESGVKSPLKTMRWSMDSTAIIWPLRGGSIDYRNIFKLGLSGKVAFCMDEGRSLPSNLDYSYKGTDSKSLVADAMYKYSLQTTNKDLYYVMSQIYIWADGDIETASYAYYSYLMTYTNFTFYRNLDVFLEALEGESGTLWYYSERGNKGSASHELGCTIKDCKELYHTPMYTRMYPSFKNSAASAGYKVYIYHDDDSTHQRLATTLTVEVPVNPGDPDITPKSLNENRNQLRVKHNINGTINASTGEGVIGSWSGYTNNGHLHYQICDGVVQNHGCDTVTITKYEEVSNKDLGRVMDDSITTYYTKDQIDALYSWETYGGSSSHYNYSRTYKVGKATEYDADGACTMWGTTIRVTTWESYNCDYCSDSGTHNIYYPNVTNYTLTLNYNGGWLENYVNDDGSVNISTAGMGNKISYSDATFNKSHRNGNTSNVTTTETTNVKFTGMSSPTHFKLLDFTSAITRSGGSLSDNAYTDGAGTYRTFTHSSNDGVASVIEFNYTNKYIVTLPEPTRIGYRFIGWYDNNGNKVEPKTISGYYNAYVITKNTTLEAKWELITKDETFNIYWLDNSNNYTSRPSAIYVELWRYTSDTNSEELCSGYITEKLNTGFEKEGKEGSADWITRFSNETAGKSTYKTDHIQDPNVYQKDGKTLNTENNIFYNSATDSYWLKISGYNAVPDNRPTGEANVWTVTLENLQKYDTYSTTLKEYTYVIKEVYVQSYDQTTQYYVSPGTRYDDYGDSLSNFYDIENEVGLTYESGQKNKTDYGNIPIKNFSNSAVNRLGNKVKSLGSWKDITVTIEFKDGPQNEVTANTNTYADDIYHFRPYALRVDLYQNFAFGIDASSDNYLSDIGVRKIFLSETVNHKSNNAWSSTNLVGYLSSSVAQGLANKLRVTFKNVPTIQDQSCIKIAYDAILTHGNSKYRYTIDPYSQYYEPNNNLAQKYDSEHYYANKHESITTTVTDLNYSKMYSSSTGKTITVVPTIWKEITAAQYNALSEDEKAWSATDITSGTIKYYTADLSKLGTNQIYRIQVNEYRETRLGGYNFVDANYNNIYQEYLEQEDDTHMFNGANNYYANYSGTNSASGTCAYTSVYKSMAYNVRYYKITEDRNMIATPTYYSGHDGIPFDERYENVYYTENLLWNFTLTLNHQNTPLPNEYSGSASEDDRTGNYNGAYDDDFTHTNNKLIITNKVYKENNHKTEANNSNYNKLDINISYESFLITLKQVQKTWNSSGYGVYESYNNNKYSPNGYMTILNNNSALTKFVSNSVNNATTIVPSGSIAVGNEYNVLIPANKEVIIDYLPDGKYEITCHYDIDFDNFNFTYDGENNVFFSEENGKHYVTFTSKDVITNESINHAATIDYWRGYVDDENNNVLPDSVGNPIEFDNEEKMSDLLGNIFSSLKTHRSTPKK